MKPAVPAAITSVGTQPCPFASCIGDSQMPF